MELTYYYPCEVTGLDFEIKFTYDTWTDGDAPYTEDVYCVIINGYYCEAVSLPIDDRIKMMLKNTIIENIDEILSSQLGTIKSTLRGAV